MHGRERDCRLLTRLPLAAELPAECPPQVVMGPEGEILGLLHSLGYPRLDHTLQLTSAYDVPTVWAGLRGPQE